MIKKGSRTLVDMPVSKLSDTYFNALDRAMEVK